MEGTACAWGLRRGGGSPQPSRRGEQSQARTIAAVREGDACHNSRRLAPAVSSGRAPHRRAGQSAARLHGHEDDERQQHAEHDHLLPVVQAEAQDALPPQHRLGLLRRRPGSAPGLPPAACRQLPQQARAPRQARQARPSWSVKLTELAGRLRGQPGCREPLRSPRHSRQCQRVGRAAESA